MFYAPFFYQTGTYFLDTRRTEVRTSARSFQFEVLVYSYSRRTLQELIPECLTHLYALHEHLFVHLQVRWYRSKQTRYFN